MGRKRLDHVSEFKYLGCVLDEIGSDDAECRKKMGNRMKIASVISSMANARGLQLDFERMLHEVL